MQTLRSTLTHCGLSSSKDLKAYDLISRFEKFIKDSQKNQHLLVNRKIDDQKSFVNMTIKLLDKNCHDCVEKAWVRLLFIDSFINYSSPTLINDSFVDFLDSVYEQSITKISKIPPRRTVKSKTFMGKVSNGLSKISSVINMDYFSESRQFNKKDMTHIPQNLQKSLPIDIPTKIVLQYGVYLRKKLQNYKFYIKTKEKYQKNQNITIKSDNHLLELRQYVWKIINLISHYSIIVRLYKKIAFVQNEAKPLIVAIFSMLCRDSLILYPYIVKLIEIESQLVKEKYNKIVTDKKQKDLKKIKLQALSKDVMFVQVDNLLRQLTPINETIFYLFCGKLHYAYITFQVPKHYFLNTANPKLDEIHNILKQVKLVVEKQQKSKLYRTQLSIQLDNSVSKIVQKMDNSRSIATMRNIKSTESKETQESNYAEENDKIQPTQRKKKVFSFFQEKTQVI